MVNFKACDLCVSFIKYAGSIFANRKTFGSPKVDRELKLIEASGLLDTLREKLRSEIDGLVKHLLTCDAESRIETFQKTPLTLSALVLDRYFLGVEAWEDASNRELLFPVDDNYDFRQFFDALMLLDFDLAGVHEDVPCSNPYFDSLWDLLDKATP